MHAPVAGLYAALLAILLVVLSARVIRLRGSARVGVGTGGHPALERAVRVHGNCAEYAPLGVLMLLLVELSGYRPWVTHGLGVVLVAARVVHAWGMSQTEEDFRLRVTGMVGTFAVLGVAAVLLLAAST